MTARGFRQMCRELGDVLERAEAQDEKALLELTTWKAKLRVQRVRARVWAQALGVTIDALERFGK